MAKDFFFQLSTAEAVEAIAERVAQMLSENPAQTPPPAAPEKLLTKTELEQEFDISGPTVTKYVGTGKLPCKRLGRRVYFLRSEVIAALGQPKTRRA